MIKGDEGLGVKDERASIEGVKVDNNSYRHHHHPVHATTELGLVAPSSRAHYTYSGLCLSSAACIRAPHCAELETPKLSGCRDLQIILPSCYRKPGMTPCHPACCIIGVCAITAAGAGLRGVDET
jgi:hypothetical protein